MDGWLGRRSGLSWVVLVLKLLGKRVAVGRCANIRFSKRETPPAGEKEGSLDGNLARTANKGVRPEKGMLSGSEAIEC
jgi:hypothetical protein